MTERWERIKSVFSSALERPSAERRRFLEEASGDDEDVRREVEALLASHDDAETFLEVPAFLDGTDAPAAQTYGHGDRIGPYRVLSELGHGGMGTVYLAVRDDEAYRKQVALKVVRDGAGSLSLLERFRRERQLLANLDHPNIARLLDGGTTDRGQPYFVMEYVDGQPIDRYCDSRRLTIDERVRLFRTACAAVQYAHQNLIVHRDLKPDNILVDAAGTPKLVDFGIAKLMTGDSESLTRVAPGGQQRFLTYEYASPEQVRGEPITTASDVYSLGVVLYQLLTGRRPYTTAARRPEDLEREICDTEPVRPSTRVMQVEEIRGAGDRVTVTLTPESVSHTRGGAPERLRRTLRGDLDTIVLKALRKEPRRRYASVEQLSEDLRRHLEGLPVLARPDTMAYRTTKFLRRHRGAVAAAAIMVAVLSAGAVATLWQARIAHTQRLTAERRFDEVRALARAVLFDLHDGIAALPGSTPVRRQLVSLSLQYLDGLSSEVSGNLDLQIELAEAYCRVGDVLGNPYLPNLGDLSGAMSSYRKALGAIERVPPQHAQSPSVVRGRADALEGIADILVMQSDLSEALGYHRRALELRESLAAAGPEDSQARKDVSQSHHRIGDTLSWTGNLTGALDHHRRGLAIRQELAQAGDQDASSHIDLASSHTKLGDVLGAAGDREAALRSYAEVLKAVEPIQGREPDHPQARRYRAIALAKSGEILAAAGDLALAIDRQRLALAERQALVASDPANMQARRDMAVSRALLSEALVAAGRRAEAVEQVRESLAIFESLASDPSNAGARADLVLARIKAGGALSAAGRVNAAIASYRRAADIALALVAADPADATARQNLAAANLREARLHCEPAANADSSSADPGRGQSLYASLLEMLQEMSGRGMPVDSVLDPAAAKAEMARCDTAPAPLAASSVR